MMSWLLSDPEFNGMLLATGMMLGTLIITALTDKGE